MEEKKEKMEYKITADTIQKWKLKSPEYVLKEKNERENKLKVRDREEEESLEDYLLFLNREIETKNAYILYLESEITDRDSYARGLKAGLGKLTTDLRGVGRRGITK